MSCGLDKVGLLNLFQLNERNSGNIFFVQYNSCPISLVPSYFLIKYSILPPFFFLFLLLLVIEAYFMGVGFTSMLLQIRLDII